MKQGMSRGSGRFPKRGVPLPTLAVALAVAVAVIALGCTGVASAAPAGEGGGNGGAAGWAASPGLDSSGKAPSMNSELASQDGGIDTQLLGGLLLIGLGGLALVFGVTIRPRKPRSGGKPEIGALVESRRPTRRRMPAETGTNP